MKIILIALGAVMFGGVAAAETAASSDDPTISVRVSDLDLSTPDGRKLLHFRLRHAVDALCLGVTGTSPHYYAQSQCRKALWKDALAEADRVTAREKKLVPRPPLADAAQSKAVSQ